MIFKYCPDCGGECEKKDFKKYVCNKCNLPFYDEPTVACGALIKNQDNKYLFITRNVEPGLGSLSIPGGYVDVHETLEACCVRECWEETRVKIANIKYFGSYLVTHLLGKQKENVLTAFFIGVTCDTGQGDNKEIQKIMWLSKQEIDVTKIVLADVKAFIKEYLFPNEKRE